MRGGRIYLSQSPTTRDRFIHFETFASGRVKATESRYTVEGWKNIRFEGSAAEFVNWLEQRTEK